MNVTTNIICPSNSALFQLDFLYQAAAQDSTRFYLKEQSSEDRSTDFYYRFIEYEIFTDENQLEDFSRCLPSGGCYVAQVTNLLYPELFEFVWDGETLPGEQFPYRKSGFQTVVEFGDGCVPKCDADEKLFELEYYTGEIGAINWRLEDIASDEELVGCNEYNGCGGENEVIFERLCIPRELNCTRLLIGHAFFFDFNSQLNPRFEVKLDGQSIAYEYNMDFHAIDIGDNCPTCSLCLSFSCIASLHLAEILH